jgi:hypothetical protein
MPLFLLAWEELQAEEQEQKVLPEMSKKGNR